MLEAAAATLDQIRACLLGALCADALLAEDLLIAAECVAETGGLDVDGLRGAGLGTAPAAAGIVVRTLPYALLSPLNRPRVRRGAHCCASVSGVDEGAGIAAVAATVLAVDLARGFDLDTCLSRCHQTLLEEAPTALLTRLRPLEDDTPLRGEADPTVALQLAITALHRDHGVDAVAGAFGSGDDLPVAAWTLACALAGIRDRFDGFDASRLDGHPLRERAERAATLLAGAASPAEATPALY